MPSLDYSVLPVIMAGGSGTRLWPLSRSQFPKQYQDLHPEGGSLFSAALSLAGAVTPRQLSVVTNFAHRFMALEQMRHLNSAPAGKSRILTEPEGRNTCAVAALATHLAEDPSQVLLLMPADHYIANRAQAAEALALGAQVAAEKGTLVVFGVTPAGPVTEYGYIEAGKSAAQVGTVRSFVEKPDKAAARACFESGNYLWNSGIFMMRADRLQSAIAELQPLLAKAVAAAYSARTTPAEFEQLPADLWARVPEASFDKVIVQRMQGPIAVVGFDVGWSDLGSYTALRRAGLRNSPAGGDDSERNVSFGQVIAAQSSGNYLRAAPDRMLAVLGLQDMAVVDTADAVLVAPLDRTADLRKLVQQVGRQSADALHRHRQDYRPWGHFRVLQPEDVAAQDSRFQCKLLSVRPGAALSRQSHRHRSEHWVVVKGVATVEIDGEERRLATGESTFIPKGGIHRLSNQSDTELQIVEVQIGDYLGEDDIERYADDYGRTARQEPDA